MADESRDRRTVERGAGYTGEGGDRLGLCFERRAVSRDHQGQHHRREEGSTSLKASADHLESLRATDDRPLFLGVT